MDSLLQQGHGAGSGGLRVRTQRNMRSAFMPRMRTPSSSERPLQTRPREKTRCSMKTMRPGRKE